MGLMIRPESGAGRIALERIRQTNEKGWTLERDRKEHQSGELLDFAAALLLEYRSRPDLSDSIFAESEGWVAGAVAHATDKYKSQRLRVLEIAGALIAAEIDRLTAENDR